MAQIFSPRFRLLFKLGIVGGIAFVVVAALAWRNAIQPVPPVGAAVEQPVPFSHKHHVGEDGIDCRYCHTSVEKSSFAGIPQTAICMSCHSQLFTHEPVLAPVIESWSKNRPLHWNRVHSLPDFVYFNHGIHIGKGIGCVSCHGRVDQMPLTWRVAPLTMQWCLECHREPEKHLRPADRVFDLDWQPRDQLALGRELIEQNHIPVDRLTDCSVCHR